MSDRMNCAYCGRSKAFPDGFASRSTAQCWQCTWDHHMASKHRLPWRLRRKAEKRAVGIVKARAAREATTAWNEGRLLLELISTPPRPIQEGDNK